MKKKIAVALLLSLCVVMLFAVAAFADEDQGETTPGITTKHNNGDPDYCTVYDGKHQYTDVKTYPADCTVGGYTVHMCACGTSYKTDETEPLGHDPVQDQVTPATCVKEGQKTYKCARCGEPLPNKTEVLKKNNQNHENVVPVEGNEWKNDKAPTCTSTGIRLLECTACGQTFEEQVGPYEHKWGDDGRWLRTIAPTCTTEGLEVWVCKNCNTPDPNNITRTVAKLGHPAENRLDYTVLVAPTCTTEGKASFYCTLCKDTITVKLAALDHPDRDRTLTSAGTCHSRAVYTRTCRLCGDKKIEYGDYGPHTYVWTKTGNQQYKVTCSVSGCTYIQTVVTDKANPSGDPSKISGAKLFGTADYNKPADEGDRPNGNEPVRPGDDGATTEPTTAPSTEPTTAPSTAPSTAPTTAPTTKPTKAPSGNNGHTSSTGGGDAAQPATGDNSNNVAYVVAIVAMLGLAVAAFSRKKVNG